MNLGEIRRRVKNIVGDEAGLFIEDPDLLDMANDGQLDIVRKTRILATSSLISTVAGTEGYPLPADFVLERRVTYQGSKLNRTSLEEIDQVDFDKDLLGNRDVPQYYFFNGKEINFYPVPITSVANSVKVFYVRSPAALVNDADIPEIPVHMHEDIVRFCIMRAREQEEEMQLLTYATSDYMNRLGLTKEQAENPTSNTYPAVRDIDSGYYG